MRSEYESYTTAGVEAAYRELEYRIMEDIVRRIQKAETITSTADWQLQRLQVLGYSSKDIEDIVRKAVDGDYPETFRLYDQVIEEQYVRSKDMYEQVNEEFVPYEQNYELQQLTQALIEQTNGELTNITKSMGFMIDMAPMGQPSRLVFTPLSEMYNSYLDKAVIDVATGATDYNSAIRKVVRQLTASGLRTIDYASGRTNRVDVAARRAVMNGLSQLTQRIVDSTAEKLGAEYFEVDWHSGARPSHQEWEGQVWSKSELESVCGLGAADGLLGINCYHMYWPFFPGVSERNWTDEWLQEQHEIENTPIEFRGKEYTRYEATQRQRYLETNMRAQRETVQLLREGHANKDDIILAQCKYQAMLDEYKAFSKRMGLPEQRERIYADLRGRIAPSQARYAEYLAGQRVKYAEDHLKQRSASAAARWAREHLDVRELSYGASDTEVLNSINRALQRLEREYPQIKGFIDKVSIEDIDSTAMTRLVMANGNLRAELVFSRRDCVNAKVLQSLINERVEAGDWTRKTGIYGVAKHEVGHMLEYLVAMKRLGVDDASPVGMKQRAVIDAATHTVATDIVERATANCKVSNSYDTIKLFISKYAAEGSGEALGESLSDRHPGKLEKEIVKLLLEELNS